MSKERLSYELVLPRGRPRPHFDRATRRLIERLNRDGDHCHGCRREYRDRDKSIVGRDAGGRTLMVG